MIPITQIAYNLNLTPRAVQSRLDLLGIKGKKRITTYYYTPEQIKKVSFKKHINPSYPLLSNPNYYQNQVDIIEMYLAQDDKNASEISRVLNLPVSICERSVKFFKERNCLIIKSKL
jgi:hypothetical protein